MAVLKFIVAKKGYIFQIVIWDSALECQSEINKCIFVDGHTQNEGQQKNKYTIYISVRVNHMTRTMKY